MVILLAFSLLLTATAASSIDVDASAALLQDGCADRSGSLELMQMRGKQLEREAPEEKDGSSFLAMEVSPEDPRGRCLKYLKCDSSGNYHGQRCSNGYFCTSWGSQKRGCVHWVNCKHQCYCASYALGNEEDAKPPLVRFDDEDLVSSD
mmetsp:Transcript_26671/g.50116  ORF Transcript_26671/g.50116 Transcript_26671/m.50116 type:complete len:149 (-) Transcript_26671:51-497(-)